MLEWITRLDAWDMMAVPLDGFQLDDFQSHVSLGYLLCVCVGVMLHVSSVTSRWLGKVSLRSFPSIGEGRRSDSIEWRKSSLC